MNKRQEIYSALQGILRPEWIEALEKLEPCGIQEVRFRSGRKIYVTSGGKTFPLGDMICTQKQLENVFLAACEFSPASRSDQIKKGYVILPGGMRMGLCGRCVEESGQVKSIYPIASMNLRILREIKGAAANILPGIRRGKAIHNTLIVSAPGGGKTTLLRDAVRLISSGKDGLKTGIVDERGEIAGCVMGIPTLDVGEQSDVLEGCSKAWGISSMIRTMSPQVIAVDELGEPEDCRALLEAVRCGVRIIATAHGTQEGDLDRPMLRELKENRVFSRLVLLGDVPGTKPQIRELA